MNISFLISNLAQYVQNVDANKGDNITNRIDLKYKPIKLWKSNLFGTAAIFVNSNFKHIHIGDLEVQNQVEYDNYITVCKEKYYIDSPFLY